MERNRLCCVSNCHCYQVSLNPVLCRVSNTNAEALSPSVAAPLKGGFGVSSCPKGSHQAQVGKPTGSALRQESGVQGRSGQLGDGKTRRANFHHQAGKFTSICSSSSKVDQIVFCIARSRSDTLHLSRCTINKETVVRAFTAMLIRSCAPIRIGTASS